MCVCIEQSCTERQCVGMIILTVAFGLGASLDVIMAVVVNMLISYCMPVH